MLLKSRLSQIMKFENIIIVYKICITHNNLNIECNSDVYISTSEYSMISKMPKTKFL